MDRGAWWAAVHGVAKSQTQLSNFTFAFHFHALRRKWQPTPVFLPGESQGRGSWWAAISGVAQSQTRLKLLSSSSSIFWKYSFLKKHISCSNCVAISYVQIAHYFLLYVDGLYTFSRPLQTLGFYGFKAMKSKASLPR